MLKMNVIRNQSHLEEVQRVDHQRNLQDHQGSSKAKVIDEKVKIAELLTEAESMEKRRMLKMEAEKLHIQEKVAKAQAKFRIYEDLEQTSRKAEKIERQEGK